MPPLLISFLGFMMVITPIIFMVMDGVESDDDLINWLLSKSFEELNVIRGLISGGVIIMGLGLTFHALP